MCGHVYGAAFLSFPKAVALALAPEGDGCSLFLFTFSDCRLQRRYSRGRRVATDLRLPAFIAALTWIIVALLAPFVNGLQETVKVQSDALVRRAATHHPNQ